MMRILKKSKFETNNLIVVSGVMRSGTTWCYNFMRLLLYECVGSENVYSRFITDFKFEEAKSKKVVLIKTHGYDEELANSADFIINTHRNMDEVVFSLKKLYNKKPDEFIFAWEGEGKKEQIYENQHTKWINHGVDVSFHYNDLLNQKLLVACKISAKMNILTGKLVSRPGKITYEKLVEILRNVEKIKEPKKGDDLISKNYPHTLIEALHVNHKSSKFEI